MPNGKSRVFLYGLEDLEILFDDILVDSGYGGNEVDVFAILKATLHSSEVFEVSIDSVYRVMGFLGDLIGIFMLLDDFSDDHRFVGDTRSSVVERTRMG